MPGTAKTESPTGLNRGLHISLSRRRDVWPAVVVALLCLADLSRRFVPISGLFGAFDDDFFYYAKIAQNLVYGLGSTLDGIHRTNGYHPLWLLVISGFSAIGGLSFVCIAVTLCIALSLAATALLCARSAQILGVDGPGVWFIAAVATFQMELLMRGGMEIVLVVPLLLLLILRCLQENRQGAISLFADGLVCSACILARLDSVILVMLLAAVTFMADRKRFRQLGAFAAGFIPVVVYAWTNVHYFGALATSSAAAKQLRVHHGLQFAPFVSLWHPLMAVKMLVAVPGLACALLLLFLPWRANISATSRGVLFSIGLFPLVHLSLLCFLSDWPLWYWYLYPLALAVPFAIMLLARAARPSLRLWTALGGALVFIAAGYLVAHTLRKPALETSLQAAYDIRGFERTHPGIYGMGDRSGIVAALLDSPVVQLEGLTMDRYYLARLHAQPNLVALMQASAINYYISTNATNTGACYGVIEPREAGPSSAHAIAQICSEPLVTFTHDRVVTRIFAVPPR